MTWFARLTISMAAVAFLAGCGGGGGSDPATDPGSETPPPTTPAAGTTISGKLLAPDGSTPISNALVYVEDSSQPAPAAADRKFAAAVPAASVCGTPPTASWTYTCTASDGSFTLEGSMPASATLVAKKGAFTLTQTVNTASSTVALGDVKLAADGTKMVVVRGSFDSVEDILAKLGYGEVEGGSLKAGTEKFTLLDDDSALYQDADASGKADIFDYAIVFLNCGTTEYATTSNPARLQILRDYVNAGGRIYASDWAYDFVEQAFPDYIDFHGSPGTALGVAEADGAAQRGVAATVNATLDDTLRAWLATVACTGGSCLNADQTAQVKLDLGSWALMESAHPEKESSVHVWARGPVQASGESAAVDRPLTASFTVGSGRVTYTSYHNHGGSSGSGASDFTPLERIMQFLVFEL